ncbi:MAG: leucine-rich repeat protein [Bacteroidaceae bacterium]|nr:leucine-rich repeat protein [Bacteroidaceae bacterium]
MKHKLNSLLLVLAAMFCSTSLFAHDFEVDGIFYNITSTKDMTVEVTFKGSVYNSYAKEYSGTVTIPQSVTYAEKNFSVTSIGYRTFFECDGLTSITIPSSVTNIGEQSFWECVGLTSITIPSSVTSIGQSAFYDCSKLASISIPNSVTSIGGHAFNNTAWFKKQPEGVVYIGNVLYYYNGEMPNNASITVKEGTVSISPYAFEYCSNLTSISIPGSVTSIGKGAFQRCTGLKSITIGDGVTNIGDYAFYDCSALTSITIPNSVTSIGQYTFNNCSALTSITIPNSVTSIGRGAFDGTPWYNNQPNGVFYVGKVLYQYKGTMPAKTAITIKDGTTSISPYAFYNCSTLSSITIPNSVTSIGDYAFYWCSILPSITIPNNVTTIGNNAFQDCASLTSVTIPNSVKSIGDKAFYNCGKLASVSIGNSVNSIGNSAFENCPKLTVINIPNSVTNIGEYAFKKCTNLKSIIIPNSVLNIGGGAFYSCSGLTEITSYIPADYVFSININTFEGVLNNCVLKVPFGTRSKYANTEGWSRFSEIVEMAPETTDLILKEGTPFENANPYEANTVTYSRTLPNLMWNALFLPVKIPVAELIENYDVAYFNDMHAYDRNSDGVVDDMSMEIFLIKEGTLHANHPYFIRAKNEAAKQLNLELTDVTVQSSDIVNRTSIPVSSAYMDFELIGVYERHEGNVLQNCYAITAKGSWSPIASNSYLNPFRLYLRMTTRPGSPFEISPQALQSIRISVQGEDELTGIETNAVNAQKSTEIYDLQGRRVTNPTKGMYIVNGKKVMF